MKKSSGMIFHASREAVSIMDDAHKKMAS